MADCPYCKTSLESFRPVHGDDALITIINKTPVHSGHCEAEVLRCNPGKARITSFPMPADLRQKYGL